MGAKYNKEDKITPLYTLNLEVIHRCRNDFMTGGGGTVKGV